MSATTRLAAMACMSLAPVAASDGMGPSAWVTPTIRPFTIAVSGSVDHEPDVDPGGSGSTYERTLMKASVRGQLWRDDNDEIVLSGGWIRSDMDTDAEFSDLDAFPDRLHETRLGGLYRHVTAGKQVYGLSGTVTSADGNPFSSSEGTGILATAFLRQPMTRDAWILTLTYTDSAPILNGIPLPGVIYEWHPSPTVTSFIGVPFSFLSWRPDEHTSFDAAVSVFGTARLGANVAPWDGLRWLRLTGALEYGAETYHWPEHLDEDEQVFIRAAKITAGVSASAGPLNRASLYGGWLFAREIAHGDSILDLDERVDLPPGPVFGLSLSAGF